MAQHLSLADADTARDLLTFAGRAARVGADGIRLNARDGVMTVQTATLAPSSLLDATPTVLGMRIVHADPELICDFVIEPGQLAAGAQPHEIALPDTALSPAWAGSSPPSRGWQWRGEIAPATVLEIAHAGIESVANLVPTDAGEDVVRAVRASVWAPMHDDLLGAPAGVAFTAEALGFVSNDEPLAVFENERWMRLSTSRGHVLSRGPARVGLTDVRATGTTAAAR